MNTRSKVGGLKLSVDQVALKPKQDLTLIWNGNNVHISPNLPHSCASILHQHDFQTEAKSEGT